MSPPTITDPLESLAKLIEKDKKKQEKPRSDYYFNEKPFNDLFSFYFFNGRSKKSVSKSKFGEGGAKLNLLVVELNAKGGGDQGETVEFDIRDIPPQTKARLF